MSMEWDDISELRPLAGLLFLPQVTYVYVDSRWNYIVRLKTRNSEKACPSATLSTNNPIRADQAVNLGFRGERPATNRLSHKERIRKRKGEKNTCREKYWREVGSFKVNAPVL
jgi:hypothetical protein